MVEDGDMRLSVEPELSVYIPLVRYVNDAYVGGLPLLRRGNSGEGDAGAVGDGVDPGDRVGSITAAGVFLSARPRDCCDDAERGNR